MLFYNFTFIHFFYQLSNRLETKANLTHKEATFAHFAKELKDVTFSETKFHNLKHLSYLNHDEYRHYKIPFQTGRPSTAERVQYEEIDGKQYNKRTKE